MTRKSPIWYLLASMLAYFALWIAVPRAKFLVAIGDWIGVAMNHAHQPITTVLFIIGAIVFAIPTIAFMAAQIAVVYQFAKLGLRFKGSLLSLAGCLLALVAVVALMLWRIDIVGKLHRMPNMAEIGFIIGIYRPGLLKMLMYGLILLTAASIGCLVSLRIKDKNLLLPVVMFAASIDFWTVSSGPVSKMMAHAPEIVKAVSTPIPHAGTGTFVPCLQMGIGDPLFMAVVFAAIHRLGMNDRRNFGFVFVGMTAAMLLVLIGPLSFLPALVALAIAVVAANWREFKLSSQEKLSTAIVGLALAATVFVISHVPGGEEPTAKQKAPIPAAAPKSQASPPAQHPPTPRVTRTER